MAIWAIIPVRQPKRVQERLRRLLGGSSTSKVNRRWFVQTLETLNGLAQVERVLVISRDSTALALARDLGAHTLQEGRASSLPKVLQRASTIARGYGARAALIVPPSSPGLSGEALTAMIEAGSPPPALVILPQSDGQGVWAALASPPGVIAWEPGADSLQALVDKAQRQGVRVEILNIPEEESPSPGAAARANGGQARRADEGKGKEERS